MTRERVEHAAYVACSARSNLSAALTTRSAKPPRAAKAIPPSSTVFKGSPPWNGCGPTATLARSLCQNEGWQPLRLTGWFVWWRLPQRYCFSKLLRVRGCEERTTPPAKPGTPPSPRRGAFKTPRDGDAAGVVSSHKNVVDSTRMWDTVNDSLPIGAGVHRL